MPTVVIDTNVFWSLPSFAAVALRVVRACLSSQYQPLLGPALLAEYEDVLGRGDLFVTGVPTVAERQEVFDGFLNRCRWWRSIRHGARICRMRAIII